MRETARCCAADRASRESGTRAGGPRPRAPQARCRLDRTSASSRSASPCLTRGRSAAGGGAARGSAPRPSGASAASTAREEAPGEFPPRPSLAGRRYYALLPRRFGDLPAVAAGQACAFRQLGGSWSAKGVEPRFWAAAFSTLEGALNYLAVEYPSFRSFRVLRV
jgi:hypothetical protein